ncbi:uncharacterized protein LOC135205736 [Macrobrachium nipponense]|uniref:uncharacterized protein LOC135205736 n=1 Tax=Macrobrachium nipponense TaxID=159736 RepID=UPI0030C861BC
MSDPLDPSKLTAAELRAELQERGLDTKGNKLSLAERLTEALELANGDQSEVGYDDSLKSEEIYIKEEFMESEQEPSNQEDRRGQSFQSRSPDSQSKEDSQQGHAIEAMSEDYRYMFEGDDEDNMSTTDAEKGDEGSGLQKRRKKRPCVLLTDEQERMLGEWLQKHPFLYDRGLNDFKEVAKKTRLLAEKAKSLNPPLTGSQLSTWLKSTRTRYGRLTKVKNGQVAKRDLTEREKWILSEFKFFGKHIVRQKKPKTLRSKESAAVAATAPPEEPGKVVVSAGGDEDEVTVIPAIEEQGLKNKQRCEPVIENAEATTKKVILEIESNPKEAYWNLHLKKVAKDCTEIDSFFYPYLQTEISFLVQKLQKATKEGRLTASFDLFPSTRQTFLEMEQQSSTRSFPSHPPAPVPAPTPVPAPVPVPSFAQPEQVYQMTGRQLAMYVQSQRVSPWPSHSPVAGSSAPLHTPAMPPAPAIAVDLHNVSLPTSSFFDALIPTSSSATSTVVLEKTMPPSSTN